MRRSQTDDYKKLLPLKKIAQASSYSFGYVSILVQRKKLKAKKIGNKYYSTREWFDQYLELHARDEKRLSPEVSKELSAGAADRQPVSESLASAKLKSQIDNLVDRAIKEKLAASAKPEKIIVPAAVPDTVRAEKKEADEPLAIAAKIEASADRSVLAEVMADEQVRAGQAEKSLAGILNNKISAPEARLVANLIKPEEKLSAAWSENIRREEKDLKAAAKEAAKKLSVKKIIPFKAAEVSRTEKIISAASVVKNKVVGKISALKSFWIPAYAGMTKRIVDYCWKIIKKRRFVFKASAAAAIIYLVIFSFSNLAPLAAADLSLGLERGLNQAAGEAKKLAAKTVNSKYLVRLSQPFKKTKELAERPEVIIPGKNLISKIKTSLTGQLIKLAGRSESASLKLENNFKARNRIFIRRLAAVKEQVSFIGDFWSRQFTRPAANLKLAALVIPEQVSSLSDNTITALKGFLSFKNRSAGRTAFNIGAQKQGEVAGAVEVYPAENLPLTRLLALANTTSRRGQEVIDRAKHNTSAVLENTANRQKELSLSFGRKLAGFTLTGAHGVSLVSKNGQQKLALLENAIKETNKTIKQTGQGAGQSVQEYNNSGAKYLAGEAGRSLWSLGDLYSKIIDRIIPESLKTKYAKLYEQPRTIIEKEVVVKEKTTIVKEAAAGLGNQKLPARTTQPGRISRSTVPSSNGNIIAAPLKTANNNLSITGNADIGGELNVSGPVKLKNKLIVLGKTDFNADVTVAAALTAKTLLVTDYAQFAGSINAKDLTADNLTSRNNLTVVGDSFIGGNELISGNLKVSGTFQAGHTEFTSLGVTGQLGAQSLSAGAGGLVVNGNSHLSGAVDLNEILDIDVKSGSALTVGDGSTDYFTVNTTSGGSVTISAPLVLSGATQYNGNMDLNGILDLDTASTSALTAGDGTVNNFTVDTVNDILTLGYSSTTDQVNVNAKQIALNSAGSVTALLVNYDGSGNIIQILDNGVDRFNLADNGNITQTASTTGYAYTLNQAGTGGGLLDIQDQGSTRFSIADLGITSIIASSTSGTALSIRQDAAGDILNLFDGASEVLTVLDGGNVGIGTTSPGTIFSLGNTGANTINISATATSTFGYGINVLTGCLAVNGVCVGGGSGSLLGSALAKGYFVIGDDAGLSQATSTLFLSSTGNLGIGTTSPYDKLSVSGRGVFDQDIRFDYFTATSTSATSTFSTGGLTVGTSQFIVQQTSGNVGIGTTNPNYKLEINGAASTTSLYISQLTGPLQAVSGLVSASSSLSDSYITDSLTIAGGTISGASNLISLGSDATGDIYYRNSSGYLTRLAIGTGGYVLGSVSGLPGWVATTTLATISGTLANTQGGTGQDSSTWNGPVSVSAGVWSATTSIGVQYGGTGLTSATAGYALIGNSATALSATSSLFVSTAQNVGIGTTTPNWLLQAAGTRPFFVLSDSSATADLKHWLFSSMGGNLYISTSSDAYATSTMSALTINSNSRIGIGTTSPFEKLAVQGGLAANYLTMTGTANATSTFGKGGLNIGNGQFIVQQNSGRVGIGTDTPLARAHIESSADALTDTGNINNYHLLVRADDNNDNDGVGIAFIRSGGTSSVGAAIIFKRTDSYNQGELQFYTKQSTSDNVDPVKAMVISNAGKIGIGSSTPAELLSVQGNALISGNLSSVANLTATGTITHSAFAYTGLAASTEKIDVNFNLARTVQFASGDLAAQRALLIQAPTYSFAASSTLTDASTLSITGAPLAGTNATTTNVYALKIAGGSVRGAGAIAPTNGYGLYVDATTGATNNYGAIFASGNVGIGTTTPNWKLQAAGTRPFFTLSDTGAAVDKKHWFLSSQGGNFYVGTSSDALNATTTHLTIDTDKNSALTFLGAGSGLYNKGQFNTYIGYQSGFSSSTASTNAADYNTAVGYQSLYKNTTGSNNTAMGYQSLISNTTGGSNTANGSLALYANTTGGFNTANGVFALYLNTTGGYNAANGNQALFFNTTGGYNTANGYSALSSNTTGASSTAIGYQAGYANTTGNFNTYVGFDAGSSSVATLNYATAIGAGAQVNRSSSLILGGEANSTYAVNVGLGTTTPNWLLQANGTRPFFTLSDSSAGTDLKHWFFSSQGGNLYVGKATDAYATTTSLTILNNGNVGIGTTSPAERLSVNGNTEVIGRFTAGFASWSQVGNSFSTSTGNPALAALNSTDVAFYDSTADKLRTMRFDGTNWAQVGASFATSTSGYSALAALNSTDVAFIDSVNDSLTLYRFDGTNWAQVGNGLGISGITSIMALAALNSTDVAFIDSNNDSLRTYRFDGTNWAQVGNSLSAGAGNPSLAALNSTDVAFAESANDSLITYRFDGTNWAQVGNSLSLGVIGNPSLAVLNSTDVAFIDSTNLELRTYRLAGTDWAQFGKSFSVYTSAGTIALAALNNSTDVAFIDGTNDALINFRFSSAISLISKDGKTGIGVTEPNYSLDIRGSGTADPLEIASSTGTSLMRLNTLGNFGIGTTTPNWLLQAAGTRPFFTLSDTSSAVDQKHWFLSSQGGNFYIGTSSDSYATSTISALTILSNSNLGVGTSSPFTKFSVAGSIGADYITAVSTTATSTFPTGGFTVGTSQFVVQQTSGNVGIGTAGPAQTLDVRGTGQVRALSATANAFTVQDSAGISALLVNFNVGGTNIQIRDRTSGTNNILTWSDVSNNSLGVFTDTGNVGIGTTTPNALLNIASTLPRFYLSDTDFATNGHWFMENDAGVFSLGTTSSALAVSGTRALSITNAGNVGLGTTSPSANLDVYSATPNPSDLMFKIASSTGVALKIQADGAVYSDNTYTSTGADYAEYFRTNDSNLIAGETVCIDLANNNAVQRCVRGHDNNIMGIVSTKPSILGNGTAAVEKDPARYVIIGMLGQVDAYVSAENGPVKVGDSLTSASSTPGYSMRADGGDSTVGIALEPLASGQGKIKVLISRRNKSLAVEEVEALVIERIANMKIEDQVQAMIKQAVDNLNLDPKIIKIATEEANKLDAVLTVRLDDVNGVIANLRTETLASINHIITNYELRITNLDNAIASTTALSENIKIDESGKIVIGKTPSNSPLSGGELSNPPDKGGEGGLVQIVEITEIVASSTKAAFVVNQQGDGQVADFQTGGVSIMNIDSSGQVKIAGSMLVDGRIMLCAGGHCSNALDSAVDETMADLGVEGKVVAGAFEGYCEDGYAWVPGSAKYGTLPGFCVMKDLSGVNLNQGQANAACQALGTGYHLISENEWLTMAENILAAGNNLASSSSFRLTNDNIINNLAGSVAQWTNQNVTEAGLPVTPDRGGWHEYSRVIDYKGLDIAPNYYLTDADNHIGKIYIGSGAGLRAFARGAGGIYGLDLSHSPAEQSENIGFRCAK